MAEETTRKTKYTVIHVPLESLPPRDETKEYVVMAPHYDHEIDEPLFERAWASMFAKVKERTARGEADPTPPLPPGGIQLRGRGAQQRAAKQAALEAENLNPDTRR